MEAEMYFHTKAFLLPKWNDNEKRTECAFNRENEYLALKMALVPLAEKYELTLAF